MESVPVRRKSCLLRIRESCPFRKLRRNTYDVSKLSSPPICSSYWNQPIDTVHTEPIPSISSVCSPNQSEAAPDFLMEEDEDPGDAGEEQQNQQDRAEESMDLDDHVDPETGEKAQG